MVSKSEKQQQQKKQKGGFSTPLPVMPLGPFDLLAQLFISKGPDLLGGGPANNILRGALSAAADTADS